MADRATRLEGSPHLSCKRDQIKMRDYMDRRVTPPKWVTMPTWGPPRPCKQALKVSPAPFGPQFLTLLLLATKIFQLSQMYRFIWKKGS